MKGRHGIRLLGLLLAVLLCLPVFPLNALADEYDPLYPEILSEGHLSGTSAILIEADSGDVIFEKNADTVMYPASTTKIMSIWLALTMAENLPGQSLAEKLNNNKFTVSEHAVNLAPDESSAKLAAGEEVKLIDLCYAAILPSGNDAATAIAEGLAGSEENFAAIMNQAAYSLGCTNTHFVNANGLHDDNHYTTARDMAIMSRVAMQNEIFKEIVIAPRYIMSKDNIYRERSIVNRNNFVAKTEGKESRYYEYATGVKTGTTSLAGNCLVASASKDGINLIAVIFNASTDAARYTDAIRLMNYGFAQYVSTSITEIYNLNPRVIDTRNFALDDEQVGRLTLKLRKVNPSATDLIVTTQDQVDYWVQNFSSITVTEFTREFKAPITEDEVMGTMTYYPENGTPVVYELLAGRSISAREQLAPSIEEIIASAENDPTPFPRITFELVFLYLILPAVTIYLFLRGMKFLFAQLKRKSKVKAFKPSSRYYR